MTFWDAYDYRRLHFIKTLRACVSGVGLGCVFKARGAVYEICAEVLFGVKNTLNYVHDYEFKYEQCFSDVTGAGHRGN